MNAPPPSGNGKLGLVALAGAGLATVIAAILGNLYADEGGYINHPNDPGGATNYGITEKVARKHGYKGDMRDFPMHCTESAKVCADEIYFRDYIERPGYLPLIPIEPAVADELVNTTVNMGPGRPGRWFQQALNELAGPARLKVDGKIGPKTIAQYRELQGAIGKVRACVVVLDRLDEKQEAEYDRLVQVNPRLKVFRKGWQRRIGNVDRKDCGKGWA